MKQIETLKSYIAAPKSAKITNLLREVEFNTDTELTITAHEKGWIKEVVYFAFRGEDDQLKKVQDRLENSILDYKMSGFRSENYRIKSLNIKDSEHNINMTLQTSKLSDVSNLPKKIADSLDIHVKVEENNNGFLKGKTVTMETSGTPKKMQAFKKLMQSHLIVRQYSHSVIRTKP